MGTGNPLGARGPNLGTIGTRGKATKRESPSKCGTGPVQSISVQRVSKKENRLSAEPLEVCAAWATTNKRRDAVQVGSRRRATTGEQRSPLVEMRIALGKGITRCSVAPEPGVRARRALSKECPCQCTTVPIAAINKTTTTRAASQRKGRPTARRGARRPDLNQEDNERLAVY